MTSQIYKIIRHPGAGLLTLSTGTEIACELKKLYWKKVENWEAHLNDTLKSHTAGPLIIGFPSDSGAGICRGSAHGPAQIRKILYKKHPHLSQIDLGDIPCIPQLSDDSLLSAEAKKKVGQSLWGSLYSEDSSVSPLNLMSDFLVSILKTCPNSFPVNLGGDHSMGEAVTFALHKLGKFKNAAFLHIDAHPDLIPARFGIEHCFTTWVYNSLPFLKNTEQCVQVGIRQTKISKEDWYKKTGVHQYWQKDLKKLSPKKLFSILNEHWKKLGCQSLYISFDIDALDPKFAPSTGTPEKNGMTLNYATELLKLCKKHWPLIAFDLVEVAPVLGSALSHKRTLSSAVAILESILLGQVLNKNLKSS